MRNALLAATALALARSGAGVGVGVAILSTGWAVNVCAAGAALGAYGARLLRHAAVYGMLELGAFSIALAICLRLMRNGGRVRRGEVFVVGALLVVAALSETVWTWRL